MEDEHEPILIFAYAEEAERYIPITDEDMERGYLEPGWIFTVEWSLIVVNGMGVTIADPGTRTIRSLGESWQLHRVTTGGIGIWAYCTTTYYFPANKVRLSDDEEVVFMPMRVADLQPGMVFRMPRGFYVCLPAQHVRMLGDGESSSYPDARITDIDLVCSVCCTRPPSMQFILK